jgi:hypothetical protein
VDKEIRNRIQRATQAARALLEHEYAEQLEGTFDIRLDGTIAAEPGGHLDAAQQVLRTKLVAAVEHVRSSVVGHQSAAEAVTGYLREAAFTTLNRFVALKMLEARGLVQECISHGEQSTGFKEFTGLAPGLVQLPDHGYRLYIESLFDEIGCEVRVLFDRRDPASLLWPRRQTLQQLLDILNDPDLARPTTDDGRRTTIWHEDETIGWVYQYFNSDEERRQMRSESQAPRNSRELAVRNQFFTPRYVVEFLTDNTLGRIWYEMRQGKTRLVDECDYLVRRPTEVFLAEGESLPDESSVASHQSSAEDGRPTTDDCLSQEELLKKPVYIPFRAKKDPRDLKILDPACGSGHFLLYTFALLVTIYAEAWEDDSSPSSEVTGRNLRDDYATFEDIRRALPGLVLRHNLYGIDIDPRAVQIAALALWMRAQRLYNDFEIVRGDRLPIAKTNIVVAEPMPGEEEFRQEFIASLDKQLGQLVERVFEKMELAGEAGSLLKIEDEINSTIRDIYGETGEFFRKSDEERWREAEDKLVLALYTYAEQVQNGNAYRRRLFAEDAARGLGFINVCRNRYDVVLMNPPFGEPGQNTQDYLRLHYSGDRNEIIACFLVRVLQLTKARGRYGALSSRTVFFNTFTENSRRQSLLGQGRVTVLADLGWRVLDGAAVEAAAYCAERTPTHSHAVAIRALRDRAREEAIVSRIALIRETTRLPDEVFLSNIAHLRQLPHAPLAYWMSTSFLAACTSANTLRDAGVQALVGLSTADNFRYLRLAWEVPEESIGRVGGKTRWIPLVKGGEYNPFYDDIHLVLDWASDGRELLQSSAATVRNAQHYGKSGATYPYRTTSGFCVRLLPRGCAFSDGGHGLIVDTLAHVVDDFAVRLTAYCHSRVARAALEMFLGEGGATSAEGAARNYVPRAVEQIPLADVSSVIPRDLATAWAAFMRAPFLLDETCREFAGLPGALSAMTIVETASLLARTEEKHVAELLPQIENADQAISLAFHLQPQDIEFLDEEFGPYLCEQTSSTHDADEVVRLYLLGKDELTREAMAAVGARRYTAKKMYWVSRRIELICRTLSLNPKTVVQVLCERNAINPQDVSLLALRILSWGLGYAFGRWNRRMCELNLFVFSFAELPHQPPAAEVATASGPSILVDDHGTPHDIESALRSVFSNVFPSCDGALIQEVLTLLGAPEDGLRLWISSSFFALHTQMYSKSRRKAPIYWQLATSSASYSIWLYYHRFTKDTFYKVLNDYVTPKLQHEEHKHTQLVQTAGANPTASQRKEIAEQEAFVEELRAFRAEIARIAPLWNPDLNDGVIINFAPLWRLVPQHRAWQKECKACWDKLVAGDYDWAHLAMHLWPERRRAQMRRGPQPGHRPRARGGLLDRGEQWQVAAPQGGPGDHRSAHQGAKLSSREGRPQEPSGSTSANHETQYFTR